VVLLAFLIGLVAVLAATVFVVIRGLALWRQAKTTGGLLSAEAALFEERSARTERVLAENERASRDLEAAVERLRVSRAQLKVLTDSMEDARRRVRWLRAFLPAR